MLKRLLYVTNIRMPSERAHATQIVNMCNAFVQNGVAVDLVVSNRPTHITESPDTYYGQQINFSLIKASTFNQIHWGAPFYYLSALITAFWIAFHYARQNYDVVYGRDEFMLFVLFWFIGGRCMVWESHLASSNFFARFLIGKGIKIVVISEGIYEAYLGKGVSAKQMIVAHDGIDASFFDTLPLKKDVRDHLRLSQDARIAMYVGGFDSWKGIDTFCKASSLLPEVTFVAIGGSSDDVIRYKKLYPEVQFLGARPYSELPYNQQAADVLVIPNTAKNDVSSRYTSPLKLFAHMTSRVPIVASRVPSITNVLPENCAYFFEPDNFQSLSEVIKSVFNDEVSAVSRKTEGALELSKSYTWHMRARSIVLYVN